MSEKPDSMEVQGRLELREEALKLCRLLVGAGLAKGSHGNMSCYSPEVGLVCIKASGAVCAAVTEDDLVLLSIDGQIDVGARRPSIDTEHHLKVYKQASMVRAIVHTHSPYASAFAALGEPVPSLVTAVADRFGMEIPCLPYQGATADLGSLLALVAQEHPGCLVARHGVFAFGNSPLAAFDSAYAIEECAKTC
jgi:L-ribulose-5-phosphate 4-epimerase